MDGSAGLQAAAEELDRARRASALDPKAPYSTAGAFVNRFYTAAGRRTLVYQGGAFYAWNGKCYPELTDAALRADLYSFLHAASAVVHGNIVPFNPNRSKVADILDALKAVAHLSPDIRPPAWLDDVSDCAASEVIAFANGLVHLPTRKLLPHSPLFYSNNAVEFAYEPDAEQPAEWFQFLRTIWPDDKEAIDTLQEVFGYLLTCDTRQQKILLLVGPKRSGKGTIGRVLTRLIGPDNVVNPTLATLTTNFGLASLIGKSLAIISDARLSSRADQQVIVERMLSISGEDALTIDRKYREPWTGRLPARFVIMTNVLPRLADASSAIASRFLILTMTESFYGREDHGLTERLVRDLPGIMNWAIAGWHRLSSRGYFRQPTSSAEHVRELEDLGSPIAAFVRECCIVAPAQSVPVDQLFGKYTNWCTLQGRARPGTAQQFGADLRAAVPGLQMRRPRDDGERIRVYCGIGLTAEPVRAGPRPTPL